MLDQTFFGEKKKAGFCIEAGAHDGEADSTTLHIELEHVWSGLLVEPMHISFAELVTKNRRAWAVQTCLSTKKSPEIVNFSLSGTSVKVSSGIADGNSSQSDTVHMHCILCSVCLCTPLYYPWATLLWTFSVFILRMQSIKC